MTFLKFIFYLSMIYFGVFFIILSQKYLDVVFIRNLYSVNELAHVHLEFHDLWIFFPGQSNIVLANLPNY